MDPRNIPSQSLQPESTYQHQSLFRLPLIIGVFILCILIGLGAFYLGTKSSKLNSFPIPTLPQQKACTTEAKICSDGSSVGRVGPNCEFAPCPSNPTSTKAAMLEDNGSCAEGKTAAIQGLPNFLNASPDYQGKIGTVGKGYLEYTVQDLGRIANYTKDQRVASLISLTGTCYFSVLIDNQPLTDLMVNKQNTIWQAVEMGGNRTKMIFDLEKQLPVLMKQNNVVSNYSIKYIKVNPMNLDFILVEAGNKEFIVPFAPTQWFGLETNKIYPADEAMSHFIQPAKNWLNNNTNEYGVSGSN